MAITDCPIPLDQFPPQAKRAVNPKAPKPARMMAARGLAPMQPRDLVTAQYGLTFDDDAEISGAAQESLQKLDPRLANAVLGDTAVNPLVLEHLAEQLLGRDADLEKILLNPTTPDAAFITVASQCSERLCDVISVNQARLLKSPEIARSLSTNGNCLKSTSDRVIDFLVRNSVILDGMAEFDQALLRLTGAERIEAAMAVEMPEALLDPQFSGPEKRKLILEDETDIEIEDDEDEAAKLPVEQLLKTLTTGQKVAFATKGNKTVRSLLLRDTNRMVALAAIQAPGITEIEAVQAANSRTSHPDVIGYIAKNKDWLRNYQIKAALVANPKTPLPTAMRLVPTLMKKDLKTLMNSRNIPQGVRNLARKMVKGR